MANVVCQTCGDQGFIEALVYCDSCKIGAVHRYCVDITPVPIEDYIIWFCVDCDGSDSGSDCKEVDQTDEVRHILEKSEKKKEESSNQTSPVSDVENHRLQDTSYAESVEVSSSPIKETMDESQRRVSSDSEKSDEFTGLVRNGASVSEAGDGASVLGARDGASVLETSEKEKKKKKSIKHSLPVLVVEDRGLSDATNGESVEVPSLPIKKTTKESKIRESSDGGKSHELTKSEERKKKKKKTKKNSGHTPSVLDVEDHALQEATNVESVKVPSSPVKETMTESKMQESSDIGKPLELTGLVSNGASVLEKSEREKKKKKRKKSSNHTPPVLAAEDHVLQDATNVQSVNVSSSRTKETMNESKRQESSDSAKPHELEKREKKTKKKKKKKKNEESSNHASPVLDIEDHELQDPTNFEPAKVSSSPMKETTEASKSRENSDSAKPHELTDLVRDGAPVLEKSEKKKKKKKKRNKEKKKNDESSNHTLPVLAAEDHGLQDTTNVEPAKVSSSPISQELSGLVRNRAPVLEKSEKKKKKKKKTTNKEEKKTTNKEEKKNEESSNHNSPVLDVEDHELQDTTNVEPVKVSKKRERSDSKKSHELTGLVFNGVSDLEKSEKKKKKKRNEESSNRTLPGLDVKDHGLQDTTNVEPVKVSSSLAIKETLKESKKRERSDIGKELTGVVINGVSALEKTEKKKKKEKKTEKEEKKNNESSNHTSPVLAVEDHRLQDTTSVEPAKAPSSQIKEPTTESKRQESSASVKPGLVKNGAPVLEAGNSSTVPDHSSCTSKKRKLSSGNIRVTCENTQLVADNSSCNEAETPQKSEKLTDMECNSQALDDVRAQPIFKPVWSGSLSVKKGDIVSIDGLVAHLSSLACQAVHDKASSLQTCLSVEMFPRLEIWPSSFLKDGEPTDQRIALYFFPSRECNDAEVYYSLVLEMKKNDSAMRCVLDNRELLLFTSYQLPMHCWTFHSKEYLWGVFRPRKTSRH